MKHEVATQTAKAFPAVSGVLIGALTLNEIVMIITGIYVLTQFVILLHKHYWDIQDRKSKRGEK